MAKVKKAKKQSKKAVKKTNRQEQVRLLEAEILANRMRDFAGEGGELYGAYGAYGVYGVYGAYGMYDGAYGFEPSNPVAIQLRPGGKVVIRTDLHRKTPVTIQIWPGGQISVQEHRPAKPKKAGKKKAKKETKKSGKKASKKSAKKKS